jgi:hypothetical protein
MKLLEFTADLNLGGQGCQGQCLDMDSDTYRSTGC